MLTKPITNDQAGLHRLDYIIGIRICFFTLPVVGLAFLVAVFGFPGVALAIFGFGYLACAVSISSGMRSRDPAVALMANSEEGRYLLGKADALATFEAVRPGYFDHLREYAWRTQGDYHANEVAGWTTALLAAEVNYRNDLTRLQNDLLKEIRRLNGFPDPVSAAGSSKGQLNAS